MNWHYTGYFIPVLLTGLLSAGVAAFAWWRRQTARGLRAFVLMAAAVAVWSLGYGLELLGGDLPTKIFWAKVEYLGIVTAPVAWVVFTAQYTGRDKWLTRPVFSALGALPALTLLLALTNESHQLIWTTTTLDATGPFLALAVSHGAWFWVYIAYSYLALLAGSLLVIVALTRSPGLYRGQARLLLIGALTPWVGNILYLSGLTPVPQFDLTPLAFAVTGLVMALALFRFQLLDLAPIARDVAIEGMPDPMLVLDQSQRVVDLNPAAERLLGQTPATAIGQPAHRVLAAWPELSERFGTITTGHFEIAFGAPAARRYYDVRFAPLTNRRGHILGRLIIAHDLTDRKHTEAALRALSNELEQRVNERTAELHQSQEALLASQKLAIVGALAAEVVHEVSNPLNTIIAAAETIDNALEHETGPQETRETYLPMITRAAWHATRIIQALRKYSRGGQLELLPHDLTEVIEDALLLMSGQIKRWGNIHLITELAPDLPRVICDRNQMAQVVVNLLSNAHDALPAGGTVTLRTRPIPTGRGVMLEVADTGSGIPLDLQPKIFEPFFTTKEIGKGSGLGLSIVTRIVSAHHGHIAVHSVEGHGATFTVTLPMVVET